MEEDNKFGDTYIAPGIIDCLIIIPIPNVLLSLLLSINIAFSLLILLISMYSKDVLEISIFPSLLLITTLFRLALNISTTRGILTDADAGKVVETFGKFVIRNNPIVGFIIFLIIVIIQFIVITKGAERVAEVSARFTLDAMPGKQMAIDADLNSGLIQNKKLEKEEKIFKGMQIFMELWMELLIVKGDAIAGIIITIINIVV